MTLPFLPRVSALIAVVLASAVAFGAATASAQTIDTVAGDGSSGFSGDGGPAIAAAIDVPLSVVQVPGSSAYYIGGSGLIRKVGEDGTITTIAGQGGTTGFAGDGGPATQARFTDIVAMALHPRSGELHVVDQGNARIRRIDSQGIVHTVAGTGEHQFTADSGPAGERALRHPAAITFAPGGDLYIADQVSIRKVDSSGVMHLVAGTGAAGYNGDGIPATGAQLNSPDGLVAPFGGQVYVADRGNGRLRVIDAEGIIRTLAENSPAGLATDIHGNLYYHRVGSARIERYLPHLQVVEPVAGTGSPGFSGDGGPALDARLGTMTSLAIAAEDILVADSDNRRVRRVTSLDAMLPRVYFESAFVDEGDTGTTPAVFRFRLDRPALVPVRLRVSTEDHLATSDHDYQPVTGQIVEIPAGESLGELTVLVNGDEYVEGYETFNLRVVILAGAVSYGNGYYGEASGVIYDDDEAGPPEFFLRDDREIVPENASPYVFPVTLNDSTEFNPDGGFTIVSPPALGTVSVNGQYVWYYPPQDWTGEEQLTYEVCETEARCLTATVTLVVRPLADQYLGVSGRTGRGRLEVSNLRAMPGARFLATPLVEPHVMSFYVGVDDTPATPWDSTNGVVWQLRTIPAPADGRARTVKVFAEDGTQFGFNATLYMGVDSNGDGRPNPAEQRCIQNDMTRTCELSFEQAAGQSLAYWVMLQSRNEEPRSVQVNVYEVPFVDGDGSLAVTAPGHLPAGQRFALNMVWNDPTMLSGERRLGYVRVKSDANTATGDFPVLLVQGNDEERPLRLVDGQPQVLALAAGASHRSIYIDVPRGATRLSVESRSDANIDLHLVRVPHPNDAATRVQPVALPYVPVAVGEGPGGNESVVVHDGLDQPARWHVVAINRDGSDARLELTAAIDAAAPVVRPGSYFNQLRSGHGLFLYPAGGAWAGIWYAYRENGSPTWYYLQAPAPGVDGTWTSPVYRSAWSGDAGHLVAVGSATVTPTGPDAFRFSYTVDGIEGSEPMAALARGCPTIDGQVLDVSSHWFDPANAGPGYSVQMMANYEFIAAFVYDGLGEPRFLLSERSGVGDADDVLNVEQLGGSCLSCAYYGPPSRTTVGTLRRVLSGGTLQSLELDAIFVNGPMNIPVPGAWSSVDLVVPLGGPGTTQGCAP
ncbi:Ig-like domain-containing protein [Arenimonas sp.]|uniref:Ig-like domain-containing protein n=1 Tax=Arenimonas sp. TaxID=1872635 RepID=UPI0035B4C034